MLSPEDVQRMIELRLDLEERDEDGKTALMYCLINRNMELATTLVSAGADIRAQDSTSTTVLMHAVCHISDCAFIEDLLNKGAQLSIQNKSGETALLLACGRGDRDMVKLLLRYGAKVSDQNKEGQTPLMAATQAGSVETMRILLSAGAQVNVKDFNNDTALFKVQNKESFFFLLQAGANPTFENRNKESVLMALVSNKPNLLDCIRHLLSEIGINPSSKDVNGNTPLIEACNRPVKDNIDLVKLLLEHGANASSENNFRLCSLSYAIVWRHLEVIKILLSAGANPSARDFKGNTLLMQLCCYKCENMDIFNLLIKAGANISEQNYKNNQSLLMFSIKSGHTNYTKRLVELGASTSATDQYGNTILHQICDLEIENIEMLNTVLLKSHMNTSLQNFNGKTALMLALNHQYKNIIDILVKFGDVNINAQDKDGKNVLMLACKGTEENEDIIKLFLKYKVSLSAKDKYGTTALMFAIKSEKYDIAKLLIETGADISAAERKYINLTALMMACQHKNFELVKLLVDSGASITEISSDLFGTQAISIAANDDNADILFFLIKSLANVANKTKSILNIVLANSNIYYSFDSEFVYVLKPLVESNIFDETDMSKIFCEFVKAFEMYLRYSEGRDKLGLSFFLKIIEFFVEENEQILKETSTLDVHDLMVTGKLLSFYSYEKCTFYIFDIVMKSPFKNVNWTSKLQINKFHGRAFENMFGDNTVLIDTYGALFYLFQSTFEDNKDKNYVLTSSIGNLIENGFPLNSCNPLVISPISVLLGMWFEIYCDRNILHCARYLFAKGVRKCQRLLQFADHDLAVLSQKLQLPDALWLTFQYGNHSVLPYLLPYWSAPPLALLLFLPPLSNFENSTEWSKSYRAHFLQDVLDSVFPTLVKIGGPLPPGHEFIKKIENYLEAVAGMQERSMSIYMKFKQLHSETPPSLKQLCRHVIRGCAQTGDDLPRRLPPIEPPELGYYLKLMDTMPSMLNFLDQRSTTPCSSI